MKPFALEMQQGITPNTPAAKRRWGVRLTILLFLSFGTFLGTPVGFCQQPTSGQKSKAQEDQQKEKTEGAKDKDAASSAKAQKPAWHIQVQKQEFGGPLISISAKKAPLGPIMAELERRLQDFRDGKVTGIPAEEAVRRIRETLKSRSPSSIQARRDFSVR